METFEIIAKNNRKSWTQRIIIIALLISALCYALFFGVRIVLQHYTWRNEGAVREYYRSHFIVGFPNIYVSEYLNNVYSQGTFSGFYVSRQTKDLDGIPIQYDDIQAPYSFRYWSRDFDAEIIRPATNEKDGTRTAYTTKNHIKVPLFFNPKASYGPADMIRQPSQELQYVSKMNNQIVEVALTFDKHYTLAEIKQKLPKNLKLNWLWIGSTGNTNTVRLPMSNLIGLTYQKDYMKETYTEFSTILTTLLAWGDEPDGYALGGILQPDLREDVSKHLQESGRDIQKATFGGVILTGKAENFAQLENQDWIFASSIGAAIPNQPYYQLDVE